VEVSNAGGEAAEEARQAAGGKVFVAVSEEVKRGKSAMVWALQNLAKDGAQFVIAHVHCPAQMIPMSKPSVFGLFFATGSLSGRLHLVKSVGCRCHSDRVRCLLPN
jgi:hypothetical protein